MSAIRCRTKREGCPLAGSNPLGPFLSSRAPPRRLAMHRPDRSGLLCVCIFDLTDQLVNFANVEQQIAQNQNLEDLVRLQSNNADFGAVNYIGREIQIEGSETHVSSQGTTWGYQFDRAAASVDLHVMDAKGRSVYSETGNLANSVRHKFNWDAKDASGNAIEPGKYSLRIVARDAAGNAIDSVVDSTGLVSGVKSNKTGPSLMLGENIEIALAEIMKIK